MVLCSDNHERHNRDTEQCNLVKVQGLVAHTHKVWAFRGMSKQQQTITKQLQNLYSWTQFYQERGNKDQIRKCQTQIAELKKAYNQLKSNKNGKTKNA